MHIHDGHYHLRQVHTHNSDAFSPHNPILRASEENTTHAVALTDGFPSSRSGQNVVFVAYQFERRGARDEGIRFPSVAKRSRNEEIWEVASERDGFLFEERQLTVVGLHADEVSPWKIMMYKFSAMFMESVMLTVISVMRLEVVRANLVGAEKHRRRAKWPQKPQFKQCTAIRACSELTLQLAGTPARRELDFLLRRTMHVAWLHEWGLS